MDKIEEYHEIFDSIGGYASTDMVKGILNEIVWRLLYHIKNTKRRSCLYHYLGWTFSPLIVFLSATVTVLSSQLYIQLDDDLTFFVSLAVTILTSLNTLVVPNSRFVHAVDFSNRFCTFQTDMKLQLVDIMLDFNLKISTNLPETEKEKKLIKFLEGKNKELSHLICDYNKSTLLPTPV